MKERLNFVLLILIASLFSLTVSASLNVSLSDQGTNVKSKSDGSLLNAGNLKVYVYDASVAGNLIYSELFNNAINNGSWSVMLGENSSNPLPLEFGKVYYKDYDINGQNIDFTNAYGTILDRRIFYSPLGDISGNYINQSTNVIIKSLNTTSTSYLSNVEYNGGWEAGGVSIRGGKIYADTGYFYNISNLSSHWQKMVSNFVTSN